LYAATECCGDLNERIQRNLRNAASQQVVDAQLTDAAPGLRQKIPHPQNIYPGRIELN
jgi:hypothetical protein